MIPCCPKVYLLVYQQLCFSRYFCFEKKLGEAGRWEIWSDNYELDGRYSALRARRGVRKSISARHNLGGSESLPTVRIRMQISPDDLNKKVQGSDNLCTCSINLRK
jgi:hypothetical protein